LLALKHATFLLTKQPLSYANGKKRIQLSSKSLFERTGSKLSRFHLGMKTIPSPAFVSTRLISTRDASQPQSAPDGNAAHLNARAAF
jgi:hypothetical protein